MPKLVNQQYWFFASVLLFFLLLIFFVVSIYRNTVNASGIAQSVEQKLIDLETGSKSHVVARQFDVQKIINARLFHTDKVVKKKIIAKKTKLKLKLEGVISADDEGLSRAIIKSNNNKPLTYTIGEKIKGTNAKLHKVEQDHVLLDRAGVLESLELARKKLK